MNLNSINLVNSRDKLFAIAVSFAENSDVKLKNKDPDLMLYTLTNIVLGFQFRIVLMPDNRFSQQVIVDQLFTIISGYIFDFAD